MRCVCDWAESKPDKRFNPTRAGVGKIRVEPHSTDAPGERGSGAGAGV